MSVKQNKHGTVAVALSGGVDSAVTALRLRRQGWHVFGVTALLGNQDADGAVRVAERLGIEHYVVDLRAEFEELIASRFARSYAEGCTPSPCGWCNPTLKFGLLLERALDLGADALATGHYVRRRQSAGGEIRLFRGVDPTKDQSYFLFALTQKQLARALFPLGNSVKQDVKAEGVSLGLVQHGQGESQDLCFVPDGQHVAWLEARCEIADTPGEIVDTEGNLVGRHRGLHAYTVGQRKGLGVALGFPAYVIRLEPSANRVVVGKREETMGTTARVVDVSWLQPSQIVPRRRLSVQIRYRHSARPATCVVQEDDSVRVVFDDPQFSITPGQIAAFYDGDELLGGGLIERGAKRG